MIRGAQKGAHSPYAITFLIIQNYLYRVQEELIISMQNIIRH
jgi:hypothetical protein